MNDCDSSGGASGSVVVVDRGTDFVAVGVIVGGANSSHDKTPYNLLKGNATLSIAVDVPIIEVINRLSGVEVRTASAAQ